MYVHRKNYRLSYLEKRNCSFELDKRYLDEVKVIVVNICQIFSSYRVTGRDRA